MESSIPNSAVALLDLIGNTEAPKGYDTLFGNNQKNWPKKLTSMTVAEVIEAGPIWTKKFHSSAAGRYQFMNATLKSLRNSEALTGKENLILSFRIDLLTRCLIGAAMKNLRQENYPLWPLASLLRKNGRLFLY